MLDGRLREKFISIHLLDTAQLGLLLSLYFRCGFQSSLMLGGFLCILKLQLLSEFYFAW